MDKHKEPKCEDQKGLTGKKVNEALSFVMEEQHVRFQDAKLAMDLQEL